MGRGRKRSWWAVEKINNVRVDEQGNQQYEVKWVGWSSAFNTWEPEANLETVREMVRDFQKKRNKAIQKQEKKKQQRKGKRATHQFGRFKTASDNKSKKSVQKSAQSLPSKSNNSFQNSILLDQKQDKVQKKLNNAVLSKTIGTTKRCLSQKLKTQKKSIDTQQNLLQSVNQEHDTLALRRQAESASPESEAEKVEEILMQCAKVEEATVIFRDQTLHFQISLLQEAKTRRFELSRDEILKINPGWLFSFYQGYIM